MEQGLEKRRISDRAAVSLVFLVNAIVLLIDIFIFHPRALNNDDWIIHGITAGAYGEASAVTVHTNYLYSWLLMTLQSVLPGINWFTVFEELFLYLAFSLAGCVVLLKNRNLLGLSAVAAISCFIAPDYYLGLHNTKLAPIVAVCGLIAVFFGIQKQSRFFLVLGSIAAIFASFLRLNAFLIGAAFAAGIGLIFLFGSNDDADGTIAPDFAVLVSRRERGWFGAWMKRKRSLIGTFVLLFISIAVFTGLDILLVSLTPGGMEYREYNRYRGMVSDFALPDYLEYQTEYEAIGISENDYIMIQEWNFADLEKFDTKTLSDIAKIRDNVPKNSVSTFLEQIKMLGTDLHFLTALALTVLCIGLARPRGRRIAFWSLFAFFICLFYFCFIGRVTHWVMSGLTGCLALMSITAIETPEKQRTRLLRFGIPAFVALASLALSVVACIEYSDFGLNPAAGEIYRTLSEQNDSLFLIDHATGPAVEIHRIVPAFTALEPGYYENSYTLGGWDTDSPAKNSILTRHSVEISPYRALLEREDVFLVDTRNFESKLTFLRENYDSGTNMSLYEVIDGYYVFAFTKSALLSETPEPGSFTIIETACAPDETVSSFTYLGAKITDLGEDVDSAYLKVYDRSLGETKYFRAKMLKKDQEAAVFTSVLSSDLPSPENCDLSVVVQRGDTYLASGVVSLGKLGA